MFVTDSKWNIAKKTLTIDLSDRSNNIKISADKLSGSIPLVITFDASSSQVDSDDSIINFEWDFWDGTTPESAWANIKHKYTVSWNYNVKLKIFTQKWKVLEWFMQVFARDIALQACFNPSKTTWNAPSEIKFDSTCSQWVINEWLWNFWDSNLSKSRNPVHEFTRPWKYNVKLQITDEKMRVSEYEQFIEIN